MRMADLIHKSIGSYTIRKKYKKTSAKEEKRIKYLSGVSTMPIKNLIQTSQINKNEM